MKQHLLAIIAVLAAIILALFSIETEYSDSRYGYRGRGTARTRHIAFAGANVPAPKNIMTPIVGANDYSPLQGETALVVVCDEPVPPAETHGRASLQNFAFLHHTAMMTLSPSEVPPLDAGMVNVTDGAGYRVAVGANDYSPLQACEFQVTIPYDPALLPQGFTEDDIQTYVYDRQYQRWVAIQRDSVNEAELLVCSRFRPWEKGLPHTQNDMANPQDALAQVQDMMSFASQGEGGGDSPLDFINAVLKTPEMPETSAYTPTSIKELKAADPLEGMTLIQPPTANNSGTANLSYPIEIPAGRQGMQPNLALTYSSGGGNGWLGVGWDIPIPSITVETRWGVPRYDATFESEVYVYEGEQLVTKDGNGNFRPMPHRTNQWTNRSALGNEEQFYPRKNEAFDSIVRHGYGPDNYWWSVTHRNGVTDYYGKQHNSDNVDYNSVLCDSTSHNIAQWMITESVDPSGNWVRYYYHKDYQQTVHNLAGLNKGVQIYIDSIRYTGHASSDPKYSVRFNLNENNRKDIITSGRYGFREVTASTLCNVEVLYKNTILRRYYFVTDTSSHKSNFKTRLTDLVRMDPPIEPIDCDSILSVIRYWNNNGSSPEDLESPDYAKHLVRYSFDYYDYPEQDSLFSATKTLNTQNQNSSDNLHSAFSHDNEHATALGATRGFGHNMGGTVTVGVPDKNMAITDFNVGGNFSYSQSVTEGLLTLIDLDGDGLADKVFKRNNQLYYRPQVIDPTDSLSFHFGDIVPIPGIRDFLYEESHQPNFGVQGSVLAVVAASAGAPVTISTTPVYFTDINGDGLPDLVNVQGALFNSLDEGGHPYFTPVNNYRTDSDGNVNMSQVIVTSTTAPCGGIIFDGIADSSIFCDYQYIRKSIFCDSLECELIISDILEDSNLIPIGFVDSLFYYYLMDSEADTCGPMVVDPDLDAVRVWVAPFDGNITVTSKIKMIPEISEGFQQSRYADGVKYSIEKHGSCWVDTNTVLHSLTDSVKLQNTLGKLDTTEREESCTTHVNKYDILFFRLQSKESRSYDNVEWLGNVDYLDTTGTDVYRRSLASYSSSEDFVITGQQQFQASKKGKVILSGKLTGYPGDTCKLFITHGSLVDSLTILDNINDTALIDTIYNLENHDIVMFEIKGKNNDSITWGNIECKVHLTFQEDTTDHSFIISDELSCYMPVKLAIFHEDQSDTIVAMRKFFGPLYRGWGQFAYKNDSLSVSQPIELASLRLPPYLTNSSLTADSATFAAAIISAIDTSQLHIDTANNINGITVELLSSMIDSIFNPLSDNTRWVEMNPDMEHYCWTGFGNTTAVSRSGMSNTRPKREIAVMDGDDYPTDMTVTQEIPEYDHPVPVSVDGYPVQTIRRMNVSFMGDGSLSVIGSEETETVPLSMGLSVSGGANFVISDYLDLNGDRYPDLLCKKQVQYTMPWGGIGAKQTLNYEHDELCNSNTRSGGSNFSGSYPVPRRQAGGNPQKAKITIEGLGGSATDGEDETSVMYLDMNGDGLPDRVYSDGLVALNTGYGFDAKENWDFWAPRTGSSTSNSNNLGPNFGLEQVSIGGGLGRSQAENVTESQLMDFNGDGLPDKVRRANGSLQVSYNLGNGEWSPNDIVAGVGHISQSHSFSETGNGAVTIGVEPFAVKIQIGVQLTPYNSSFSHDNAQLTDINGDGYPDYVTSDSENSMKIRYNTAGKTNLLKTVTNFTGSTITLDYDMPLSCYEKPQRGWNLASVEVNDPASPLPAARSLTKFSYSDPHYNRYERMDFGYGWVKTSQFDTEHNDSLYRYTVEEYENRSFTKRGRKLRDCLYDAADSPYVEHRYFAVVYDRDNEATVDTGCARAELYVGQETELALYYEGKSVPSIVTRTDRWYDSYRNVTFYTYIPDTTHVNEYFNAEIEYATGMPHNLVSLPAKIEVENPDGVIMQKRTAKYTSSGKLQQLANYSSLSDSSVHDFSYDSYGCLTDSWLPNNKNNQRIHYQYQYDPEVHTYPVRVDNVSLHFFSTAEYDYKFGKPIKTTDINGNDMRYTYDYMGRLLEILAPYEAVNVNPYTIRITYIPKNYDRLDIFTPDTMQNYACTFHYDPANPNNELRAVVITDGLGRLLQTKKDAEIGGQKKCLVTGKVVYDCFGRTVMQYYPFIEDTGTEHAYNDSVTAGTATSVRYDILDRQTYTKTPMGYVTTMTYDFDTCMGRQCFRTSVTDPMNNTVKTLTGTLGQQLKQIAPMNTVTRFEYDCLGRLKKSTDPDNISTYYTYDMLGRLTKRIHPDAGTDRYHYDPAGNLTAHVNALSDSVIYGYNFNQLMSVKFPRYPANNVYYHYGISTDANINAVGKVVLQEDASGWQTFSYGKLGEVTENIRTFAPPFENQTYTFAMKYEYDSWNRIQKMTYPDGEVVSYGYNRGGMLESVVGNKNGNPYRYIDSIHYNKFELKDTVWYGNGAQACYTYDSLLRLSHLRSECADGVMQDIDYDYDSVSNITEIRNTAPMLANGLGNPYFSQYVYDNLYRLTKADGWWYGECMSYQVQMAYHSNGRIQRKCINAPVYTQTTTSNSLSTVQYDNYYHYNSLQPNTLFDIDGSEQQFEWNAQGNMTRHTNGSNERYLCWDEQNRLLGVKDNRYLSYYQYDANGDRTYKLTGKGNRQNLSGEWYYYYPLDNATLYASPYLVATGRGYTKHYYAETERVASRIGGGGLQEISMEEEGQSELFISHQGRIDALFEDLAACLDADAQLMEDLLKNLYDWRDSVRPEKECYWYHPDHLGSSSWITFSNGRAVQHLHYLPWGEDFVNQRTTDFSARFTFSAKEKDLETGLSYFGSRYYSSDLSIWLSVDPMAAKYPSLSPYVYCANNPIKLVDPNGEEINPIFNKSGKYVGKTTDEAKNRSAIIMDGYSKENYPNGITVSQATSKNAGGVFLNEYKEGINISDQEWDKAVAEGGERMFPFVENHSNETIYFKPERSKGEGDNRVENDGAYPLGAGKDLYMPVDGVATSKYNDNVGKIPTGATIKITKEGGLNIDFHGFGGLIRLFPDYGWVNHNWQKKQQRGGDYSWDKLFNKAGQIGRRPY